jgi:thiol-disulfide isomerase/thioredoxin/uncharacterized membrane protein YphA (DoxX/SURF4 family)
MNAVLLCGRILLAIVFASAGVAKAFDPSGSGKAVTDFGLPETLLKPAVLLLPIAELATAALLLSTSAALLGAAASLGLLFAFAVGIAANLLKGRRPECHCFGQFHSRPISWALLRRDVTLAAVAAVIIWKGPGMSMATAVGRFMEAAVAQPLPFAAVSVAVAGFTAEALLLFALFHQHGRLLLRMDKLEQGIGGVGSFALTPPSLAGLPLGTVAPSFKLSSENGQVPLETLITGGRPVLLVFTDPDCQACAELLPDIERWEHQYAGMITFVVISRPTAPANGRASVKSVFRNMAWQKEREISESYKIGGIPAAVVVRPDATIGTWVASGRPAIQSLITFLLYMRMLVSTYELAS